MEQCWAAEPSARPLLGNVQPQLEAIQHHMVIESPPGKFPIRNCSPPFQRRIKTVPLQDYRYDQFNFIHLREF